MSLEEESKEYFLKSDMPIPTQYWALVSFVDPGKVLEDKKLYYLWNFEKVNHGLTSSFEEFKKAFLDFEYANEDRIENEFERLQDFTTTKRGFKVRGVFAQGRETEMKARAKTLRRMDPGHHIYTCQVGEWGIWDPNPDKIEEEDFLNEELNTMMQKKKENELKKMAHVEEEKRLDMEHKMQKKLEDKERLKKELEQKKLEGQKLQKDGNELDLRMEVVEDRKRELKEEYARRAKEELGQLLEIKAENDVKNKMRWEKDKSEKKNAVNLQNLEIQKENEKSKIEKELGDNTEESVPTPVPGNILESGGGGGSKEDERSEVSVDKEVVENNFNSEYSDPCMQRQQNKEADTSTSNALEDAIKKLENE